MAKLNRLAVEVSRWEREEEFAKELSEKDTAPSSLEDG